MIINMNGAKAPETPSSVLQEKTVTPETLPTVIGPDEGYDGLSQVTVNPDSQLKAENIRSGKSIFGVTGAFEGSVELTDGIPFDDVWSASDNYDQIVLHRFNNDELIASTEKAPDTAYNISYGVSTNVPMVKYYNHATKVTKGKFSSILSNSHSASWWSTSFLTPEVIIPAQTVTLNYYNVGTDILPKTGSSNRMLARFVVGVTDMVSATDNRPRGGTDVANKKENLKVIDVEMNVPRFEKPVQLEIPEMTIAPTHVRYNTSSYSYAVVLCSVSWREI